MLLYYDVDRDFSLIQLWRYVPSLWKWKHVITVIYVKGESLVQWLSA